MRIRGDFLKAQQAGAQASAVYHQHRLQKVTNGNSLLDFPKEAGFLIHVVPENSFRIDDYYRIDMRDGEEELPDIPRNPYSGAGRLHSFSRTATGIARKSTVQKNGETLVGRYGHISPVGIVEAVAGRIATTHGSISCEQTSSTALEATVVSSIRSYTSFLENGGLSGPYEVHFSMFGMEDVAFIYESGGFGGRAERFQSDIIDPFPVLVSAQDSDVETQAELSPLLESVWRAAGYFSVQTIDEDGNWELEGDY